MKTPARFLVIACLIFAIVLGQSRHSWAAPAPATAPMAPAEPLDLTDSYQSPASGFDKSRWPWRAVPRGPKTFGNVPLAIGGSIVLWGEANAKIGMEYPEKVEDIPVKRKFESLYVYHATFFESRSGAPVYHLIMQYADDTSSMNTICYGAHVRDWYKEANEPVSELTDSKSKMVWIGDNPDSKPNRPQKLRFFITPLTNPRPQLEVKSISLVSAKGNSAGVILAMTTGPDNLLKVDKSVDK